MQTQIITYVFEAMKMLKSQRSNKGQFHIKDAIRIVRLQHKIAIGITNGLL